MKIRIEAEGRFLTATLIDSRTTQDFLALLPLRLTLGDLFRREKFGHLPKALSREAPRRRSFAVGQLAYWPPGPDLAIFYRHDGAFIPAPGIIVLGTIDAGLEALAAPGPLEVTIESAD